MNKIKNELKVNPVKKLESDLKKDKKTLENKQMKIQKSSIKLSELEESIVALGLVRQALDIGKGNFLPKSFQEFLDSATAPYTQDMVLSRSGISLALYENLIIQLTGQLLTHFTA